MQPSASSQEAIRADSAIPPSPQGKHDRLVWWDRRVRTLEHRVAQREKLLTQLRTKDAIKIDDDIAREDVSMLEHEKSVAQSRRDIENIRDHCNRVDDEIAKEKTLRQAAQQKKRKTLETLAKLQEDIGRVEKERDDHEQIIAECHKTTREHNIKHKSLREQVNSRQIVHTDLMTVHQQEKTKREELKIDMKQKLAATMLTPDQWGDKVIQAEDQLDSYRKACEAVREEIESAIRRKKAYSDAAEKSEEERLRYIDSIADITEEIRELQLQQTQVISSMQDEQSSLQKRTQKWIEARDSSKVWLLHGPQPAVTVSMSGKTALFSGAD